LVECVKCGGSNPEGSEACSRCTWPFARSAWSSAKLKIGRITLDTGCVNAKGHDNNLNTLERWAAEGHLELQRSAVMLQELKGEGRVAKAKSLDPHPELFDLNVSILGSRDVLAGPDIPEHLQRILFPTANPITDNQRFDVEHLRLHVRCGGDVFVTLNPNDFITRGRQSVLASFGIWVMSPQELVVLLTELYGWQ